MDMIYGSDRKLSELGDRDFPDFLDHDLFRTPHGTTHSCYMDFPLDTRSLEDGTWMNSYFDPVIDNDLIEEPRLVKSEHSYSLNNGNDDAIDLTFENKMDIERDSDLLGAMNPNLACLDESSFIANISSCDSPFPSHIAHAFTSGPSLQNGTTICQSVLQRTLTTSGKPFSQEAKIPDDIKIEPLDLTELDTDPSSSGMFDASDLPLTPPLSSPSSSDNEGSQGLSQSGPSSPNQKRTPVQHEPPVTGRQNPWTSSVSQSPCYFANHIPTSGILILTEEEKRTLVAEGYPLPTKLPLTKQEEKNLKKIRRKIKNKISAQESRRKKKEYLESLEKKVESMSQENMGLKKKIDILENNNRSLASELQKLQSMASKVMRVSSGGPVQVGTCVMVN